MTRHINTDPNLRFMDDGTPRSERFGDIYFSPEDGLAETRHVFFEGCGLPDAWAGREAFEVLELGFGTGLNVAALIALWRDNLKSGARLHITSIEGFLMSASDAAQALGRWGDLSEIAQRLIGDWPPRRRGWHIIDWPDWGVRLTLCQDQVSNALNSLASGFDAVFLDGFSPAQNPDMWSGTVIARVADLCAPGARLATFTVAGHVRRALASAGFDVAKRPGFGRKRECLHAVKSGTPQGPRVVRRLAIVGAGIAGACLSWHARNYGLDVVVYEADHPAAGASGNPAGLVTPRLDAGHDDVTGLFADALYYASGFYRALAPHAVLGQGIDYSQDKQRLSRFVGHPAFADNAFEPTDKGLRIEPALWVSPLAVIEALLRECPVKAVQVRQWHRTLEGIKIHDEVFDAIILACGDGVFEVNGFDIPFTPVRGQIEIARGQGPERASSDGSYIVPMQSGYLFGATHERGDRGRDVRQDSREQNLEKLKRLNPDISPDIGALTSRASIRVTTRDHLPVAGPLGDGVWVLSGLGARGLCLAPLLASGLISELVGAVSPLPLSSRNLISPDRRSLRSA